MFSKSSPPHMHSVVPLPLIPLPPCILPPVLGTHPVHPEGHWDAFRCSVSHKVKSSGPGGLEVKTLVSLQGWPLLRVPWSGD